jgi:hypothetical protein
MEQWQLREHLAGMEENVGPSMHSFMDFAKKDKRPYADPKKVECEIVKVGTNSVTNAPIYKLFVDGKCYLQKDI